MGDAKQDRVAIISPYFHISGGGERFLLTIAEYLSASSEVTLFTERNKIKEEVKQKLNIDLTKVGFESKPAESLNLLLKLLKYRSLFYMTDGSLFFSPCRENYLAIQSPAHIPPFNGKNNFKLKRFKTILCYSDFVRKFIKTRISRDAVVIPPPVETDIFKPARKEKIIISVGRFFDWMHSKKQDVLVKTFADFVSSRQFSDWKLVLIGSVDEGGEKYFNKVAKLAKNLPVTILKNASIQKLADYYGRATVYWHAAGFGEDLDLYPEKAEHFGVTTVEAMAAGCVPLVFNGGGQKEIVSEGVNGFLWNNPDELVGKTQKIISDKLNLEKLSQRAMIDSQQYSKKNFIAKIRKIISHEK